MPQVKIRIEKGQETAGAGQENQENQDNGRTEKIAVVSVFANQMINVAKQTINYGISNIGVRTGNYVIQEQVNRAVDIIGNAATIGMGFVSGGIVGGIIAVAGVTTKAVFGMFSENESIRHENIQSEYLSKRSGNATTNGSRGTEN